MCHHILPYLLRLTNSHAHDDSTIIRRRSIPEDLTRKGARHIRSSMTASYLGKQDKAEQNHVYLKIAIDAPVQNNNNEK